MKFAYVNGHKTEPQPKLKGFCPSCNSEMIAKCGQVKVWHWAHKGKLPCDLWWEPETKWHRDWKDQFPVEHQEIIHHAQSGEKHIADVRTDQGVVVEFQHSYLKPEEQKAREDFYDDMVWVVDGSRLKRDLPRFIKGFNRFEKTHMHGIFLISDLEDCFPSVWSARQVPVFFDFSNAVESENKDKGVWCLLPEPVAGRWVVLALKQIDFVRGLQKGSLLSDLNKIHANAKEYRELIIKRFRRQQKPYNPRLTNKRNWRRSRF